MKEIFIRFLKAINIYGKYRQNNFALIPFHEFHWWRHNLIKYDNYIKFNLWEDIIITSMPACVHIAIPTDAEELSEMIDYFTKNHIIWHNGDNFVDFLIKHKEMRLEPMAYLNYNRLQGRLTWSSYDSQNLMTPKQFYQHFENLKNRLDSRAKEIFSFNVMESNTIDEIV